MTSRSGAASRLSAATAHLPAPLAVIDLDAFEANADALVRRAGGTPVRLASKSVRVRSLLTDVLARPGFRGVMAYSLREALWLVSTGVDDVLVAYPTVDVGALVELTGNRRALEQIALMVDDKAQLDIIASARQVADRLTASAPRAARHASSADEETADARAEASGLPVRLCVDVDASLRLTFVLGPLSTTVHLGVRRSPLHTPEEAGAFAARVAATQGVRLVGAMFYDAQVAGLPDTSAAVRLVKKISVLDLSSRRGEVVEALAAHAGPLEIINSGGTGSLETSSADPVVTEVAAGSGLFAPGLFDGYRTLGTTPSAFFGLDVVRRPGARYSTAFGGGYIGSGPPTTSRQPSLVDLPGLRLTAREGAGEVQTPLEARRASDRRSLPGVGERVWLRHAKAGEMMERFDEVHLLRGDEVVDTVPTYRGEGKNFG